MEQESDSSVTNETPCRRPGARAGPDCGCVAMIACSFAR